MTVVNINSGKFFLIMTACSIVLLTITAIIYPDVAMIDKNGTVLVAFIMFPQGVGLGVMLATPKRNKEIKQ